MEAEAVSSLFKLAGRIRSLRRAKAGRSDPHMLWDTESGLLRDSDIGYYSPIALFLQETGPVEDNFTFFLEQGQPKWFRFPSSHFVNGFSS